ncbi:poly-gamma-glutamate hydrolase family protein [Solwaraspora sp. WMMD1047]|uniref:poly-gamma-glutamate hydrolase family protein n=1 Tax=Solwaraspora sp. WMMD1047 TaxID=3016102 RepID=UPI002415F33A|nr:poly-gamma-glutamate hydrolase family protein [Solwaraspora sp. WMMD1047]MDG4830119.1 poly-gamma-glutamate hydrolase family protein [Solwaraspora sp. WMMD1047]
MSTSRRAVLGMIATAAVAGPLAGLSAPAPALAADLYDSNTDLYADPNLTEGVDYARRYRRHALLDNTDGQAFPFPRTAIIAPHGGGIEAGTSELCLAIAGYHPATLAVTPTGGVVHDYWMFEGIRSGGNADLHVTATHCDDVPALSVAASALNVVALHGCTPASAGLSSTAQAVAVGGRNAAFRAQLIAAFQAAGFTALDATTIPALAGTAVDNIANRALLGMGAQLEITTPLRTAMFGTNTRPQRRHTTTQLFWDFVTATRLAITQTEATQPIP